MGNTQTKTLHFTVEGESLTRFFRDQMLEGKEDKAFKGVALSLDGIQGHQIEQLLEGEAKLIGVDTVEFIVEEDKEYKAKLKEVRELRKRKTAQQEHDEQLARERIYDDEDEGFNETATRVTEIVPGLLKDFLKAAREPIEYKEKATPSELDYEHKTWLIAPTGEYYKVGWQEHIYFLQEYYDQFRVKDLHDAAQKGWCRVSSGMGVKHIFIDADCSKPVNKQALEKFVKFFAGYKFGYDLEMEVDFKRVLRMINVNSTRKKNY